MRHTPVMAVERADDRMGCADCERVRDGAIAQPVNTVTSAAFLVAAGALAVRARHAPTHRAEALAYSALLGLVGAGSIAFHGPQPRGSQQLHDWPIVALLSLGVATPAVRALRGRPALPGLDRRRGVRFTATALAAAAAWAGGRTGSPLCRPDSPLQLHGCWHVLAALGFAQASRILYGTSAGSA